MDSRRWENVKDLFGRALSLSGEDRNRFLIEVCGADSALRAEVQGLLDHDRSTTFLDQGAARLLGARKGGDVTFEIGEVLAGRFKIARFIGSGGMGEVYEAEDLELRVRVALKTLRPEISSDPQALNRFRQEVQLARRVTHPNVCRMFDIARHHAIRGEAASCMDHVFLTMELLEGEPLSARLRRTGHMGVEEAWPIVRQMGEALQSAHEVDVIHRDLKPSNVLLVPTNTLSHGIRAVVTDFGLARAATPQLPAGGEHSPESLTLSGRILGTPAYMAPEQIEGQPATAASDIYAFGLVLYEMVTGVRPFRGTTPISSAAKRLAQPPPAPRTLVPALDSDWEYVILRCLEREPANRFRTIQDVINALTDGAAGPIKKPSWHKSTPTLPALTERPGFALVRRLGHWRSVAVVAISVSLFAAALLMWMNRNNHQIPAATHLEYTRLTDFADSVVYPAISPDGRMLAMIRGDSAFLGAGDIYVKMLPSGQPVQLTHDGRAKARPVFSPDASMIAFTRAEGWDWQTWTVPVLGGQISELLPNASGLTWAGPHQVMFSEMEGQPDMRIVTAGESRSDERDVYRPPPGGMAHWSSLSPDSKWVLVVEMDSKGWMPCRLVPFSGGSAGKQVGPIPSHCADAAWSPDGQWMYFSADARDGYHLWRQRFPSGRGEQITFGATEERGIAVAPDSKSLVTAIGSEQSTIWLHGAKGERQISSEGFAYRPSFSSDGDTLYYLRGSPAQPGGRLISIELSSDRKEELLPGIPVARYAVSPDGRNVVFTRADDEITAIWISPLDKRNSPRKLVGSRADMPIFSRNGEVFFVGYSGQAGYIFGMAPGATELKKAITDPVHSLVSISPDGRWIVAETDMGEPQTGEKVVAYSLQGSPPRVLCRTCTVGTLNLVGPPLLSWSADQKTAYFALVSGSTDLRRTIAVPVSPREALPPFPGSQLIDGQVLSRISGARVLEDTYAFPGPNTNTYTTLRISTQRNLYRISLP